MSEAKSIEVQVKLSVVGGVRLERVVRQVAVEFAPRWLSDVAWPFPTWRVCMRPFDWAVDEVDLPVPAPAPAWSLPERRQADIYLRPAPPVVQR